MNVLRYKFLFFLVFLPAFCFAQSYCELFPRECASAKQFFAEHKQEFEQTGKRAGLSAEFLFAVVAPEFTQFSHLQNRFETRALKILYVQGGASTANFSIGYFQMQPAFVEQLEKFAETDSILKTKYADILFANPDERRARVERIERLNTLEWQLIYLSLFAEIVQKRFENLVFANNEEKLRFFASAYNSGFHRTEQHLKEIEQRALFPRFSRQKFRYSDIAVWFYREITE